MTRSTQGSRNLKDYFSIIVVSRKVSFKNSRRTCIFFYLRAITGWKGNHSFAVSLKYIQWRSDPNIGRKIVRRGHRHALFILHPQCLRISSIFKLKSTINTFVFADPPLVSLNFGNSLNPTNIKEGDDVYFECKVRSNPALHRITWYHNVSIIVFFRFYMPTSYRRLYRII